MFKIIFFQYKFKIVFELFKHLINAAVLTGTKNIFSQRYFYKKFYFANCYKYILKNKNYSKGKNYFKPFKFNYFITMGNTGFRKLLFPGDLVETPYSSLYEIKMMNLNRIEIPFSNFKNKLLLIVNVPKLNKHREEAGEGGKMEKEKKLGKRDEDYLKEILERFKGKIEILAFPCGQFGGTVGNFEEIKESYQEMLGEDFHLFAKVNKFQILV